MTRRRAISLGPIRLAPEPVAPSPCRVEPIVNISASLGGMTGAIAQAMEAFRQFGLSIPSALSAISAGPSPGGMSHVDRYPTHGDSIANEAPEEVMGIVEQQQRSRWFVGGRSHRGIVRSDVS